MTINRQLSTFVPLAMGVSKKRQVYNTKSIIGVLILLSARLQAEPGCWVSVSGALSRGGSRTIIWVGPLPGGCE